MPELYKDQFTPWKPFKSVSGTHKTDTREAQMDIECSIIIMMNAAVFDYRRGKKK